MERDRVQTERRIIDAVSRIVEKKGINFVGINAVSREAEVSKVLIYRYFDDLEGLLTAWAEEHSYWMQTAKELDYDEVSTLSLEEKRRLTFEIFRRQIFGLRDNSIMRELLRWQMHEKNSICTRISEETEKKGLALTHAMQTDLKTEMDVEALIAVITAGVTYLGIISDTIPVFNGVNLQTKKGLERIAYAAAELSDHIFLSANNKIEHGE